MSRQPITEVLEDSRSADTRFAVPPDVEFTIDKRPARLLDLSAIGARFEHADRLAPTADALHVRWRGTDVAVAIRVMRSEVVDRRGAHLVYVTFVRFTVDDELADWVIGSILSAAEAAAARAETNPLSLDESWTQKFRFVREEEGDGGLPYAQYSLTGRGWEESHSASPEQPENGFTLERNDSDFKTIQRIFERADMPTRKALRIAIAKRLKHADPAEARGVGELLRAPTAR